MDLRSTINEWIETAQERLSGGEPILLIDDLDCTYREEVLVEILFSFHLAGEELDLFPVLEDALSRDPEHIPTRFVVLSACWSLLETDAVVDPQDRFPLDREEVWERLAYFVRLRDPDDCNDVRSLRWEIVNCCAVNDYARAIRACEQLQKFLDASEANAILGRLHFMVAFKQIWVTDKLPLATWDLPIGPKSTQAARIAWAQITCCSIVAACLQLGSASAQIILDRKEHLHDAIGAFNKVIESGARLSFSSRLMLARSYAGIGDFHNAALRYHTMQEDLHEMSRLAAQELGDWLTERNLASGLYAVTSKAFEEADEIASAISVMERWIGAFPGKPGLYDRLSKLQWKLEPFSGIAYESLRKEVDRNPTVGEDPTVSMALIAWETADPNRSDTLLKQLAAVNRPEQDLVTSVIADYWPTFSKLSPDSKATWATGIWLLNTKTQTASPDVTVSSVAKVVERELRTLIFERFKNSGPHRVAPRPQPDRDELFVKYLRTGIITLGSMFCILYEARQESGSPLIQSFRRWLAKELGNVASRVALIPTDKIVYYRNESGHLRRLPTLEEAHDVTSLCKKVLDELYVQ